MFEKLAEHIAGRVRDGDVLGLGTGRTAEAAIRQIGKRISAEGLRISGLPTSNRAAECAREAGIAIVDPLARVDLNWAFDGADEVDPHLNLIKGGGGALLREKMVALRAGGIVVIVTEEKLVQKLGERFLLPVEVVPESVVCLTTGLQKCGVVESKLRMQQDGSVFYTDHGNVILDCRFICLNSETGEALKALTGVVDHGLFVGLTKEVIISRGNSLSRLTLVNGKYSELPL